MFAYSDVQHFAPSNVFTLSIPCYDVRCDFRGKQCLVLLYLQLFVGVPMSYLRYLLL